ncbi:MAG: hypothetical protein ACK559_42385, partial [bacterium]
MHAPPRDRAAEQGLPRVHLGAAAGLQAGAQGRVHLGALGVRDGLTRITRGERAVAASKQRRCRRVSASSRSRIRGLFARRCPGRRAFLRGSGVVIRSRYFGRGRRLHCAIAPLFDR